MEIGVVSTSPHAQKIWPVELRFPNLNIEDKKRIEQFHRVIILSVIHQSGFFISMENDLRNNTTIRTYLVSSFENSSKNSSYKHNFYYFHKQKTVFKNKNQIILIFSCSGGKATIFHHTALSYP